MGNGYWEKRYLQDKAAAVNRSEKYIAGQQRKYYAVAQKEIREDIEALYQKFADREKVTLAEAKRRISRADFSKVDFEKMVDYQIERNRAFREQKEKLPGYVVAAIEKQHTRYESEIRSYTKRGQVTRLELLDMQINKALLDLYDKNQVSMYDCLSQIYEDGYYRSIFAGQKAIGFGKDFTAPNTRAIEKAVLNTYNKKGYSKRLYEHCKTFSKDLKENLVTGLIRGESIETMSARISRRLDVSEADARRLVRTETAYVYEQASLKAYQECGIEMYEFLATLDHKTSKPCQELDRKRFYIKDAMPGRNYPPMHPNCRSTTVAAFEDNKVTKRLAKDKAGRYYEVPSDMAYPEWKRKYMGGGAAAGKGTAVPMAAVRKMPVAEMEKVAAGMLKLTDKYFRSRESRWSGRVVKMQGDTQAMAKKEWNCDISVSEECCEHVMIHELLHSKSASHYGQEAYLEHGIMEEVSVEFLAREICRKEKIGMLESQYDEEVDVLRKINVVAGLEENDYNLAIKLFEQPLPDRMKWLQETIDQRMAGSTLEERMQVAAWLKEIET